jgi:hypothetical protein
MSENENETVMEVVQDTTEETQEFTKIQASDAKEFTDEQLQSEFDRHEKMANEFGRLLQTKGYAVKFDNLKSAKNLLKHLENNVRWTHSDAPLFIAVYTKFKDAIAKGLDSESQLTIDGPALNSLYQLLLKSEGTGYIAVRDYISLLTTVGEGITDAMHKLATDQNTLKNVHTNLSVLDDEFNARQMGIQVADNTEA